MHVVLVPQVFLEDLLLGLETGGPRDAGLPESCRHIELAHHREADTLGHQGGVIPTADEGRTKVARAIQIRLGQAKRRVDGVARQQSPRLQDSVTFSQHGELVRKSAQDIHMCDRVEETTRERQCRGIADT